ncbi:16S rRNA (cytosine(1402)-N(4))-methyltransferase RsmH [Mycoplasma sp. ATU-Cv-508]|uniref:16S rRNA (cytosine(1402)-N(4))-methyltransferase RsmH n=1 Tax=Mycoplasma sp. ATU-Cv-508 TaxID=2048001 RepID=UPI000FDE5F95
MAVSSNSEHVPVLLDKVLSELAIKPTGIYLDLTLGRGSHAQAILARLDQAGLLIGFDKDLQAIEFCQRRLSQENRTNFRLVHRDFRYLNEELDRLGVGKVDGILADLGVSSPQFDEAHRGFSYSKAARLDMRMDQSQTLDAHQIVNHSSANQLAQLFRNNADVKLAHRVANALVAKRPIETTLELARIVRESLPAPLVRRKNVVRQVFQALRIAVNDELGGLKSMLEQATKRLNPQGRLLVITFHSCEDRIVKREFSALTDQENNKLPVVQTTNYRAKSFRPEPSEITKNKRSRSARLRVLINTKQPKNKHETQHHH